LGSATRFSLNCIQKQIRYFRKIKCVFFYAYASITHANEVVSHAVFSKGYKVIWATLSKKVEKHCSRLSSRMASTVFCFL